MPNEHLATLQKAREVLLQERRDAAEALATGASRDPKAKRSEFIELQSALDAVGRAIADEEELERTKSAKVISPEESYAALRSAALLRRG